MIRLVLCKVLDRSCKFEFQVQPKGSRPRTIIIEETDIAEAEEVAADLEETETCPTDMMMTG